MYLKFFLMKSMMSEMTKRIDDKRGEVILRVIDKFYWKLAWLMFGVLFAFAGSCMLISGTGNLDQFYDVGEVYDVQRSYLKQNWSTDLLYDAEKLVWKVEKEVAIKNMSVSLDRWEYVYMYLARVNKENFDATIVCYDEEYNVLYSNEVNLREGHNLLRIPNVEYSSLDICIEDQVGLTFDIEKMQFRKTAPVFSASAFAKAFFILLAGVLLLTGSVYAVLKSRLQHVNGFAWLDGLQKIFMYVGKYGEGLASKYTEQIRSWIRSILFMLLILGVQVAYILKLHKTAFQYVELFGVIIMCLIAFLCWENPLKKQNWKNGLVLSWSAVWVLSIISDYIVQKVYAYEGICMLFGMGFLFFMWGNMKHREVLLRDFLKGVEWSFWIITIYCCLFRPYLPGYRYCGHNMAPNGFAMHVLFVMIAVLAQIHFDFRDKRAFKEDIWHFVMVGICVCFLWKTQSVISLMLAVFVGIVFSLKAWMNKRKIRIWGIVVCLCFFGIGYAGIDFCTYHVPRALNLEIKYQNDFYIDTVTEHPFLVNVSAAEPGNDNRFLYKLRTSTSLDELTTGRTKYWKAYLRDMNLWGHKNKAHFYGKRQDAHNGILEFMHRYGIFMAIPYVLMLLYNLVYAWRYFIRHWKENKYAFFVLASILTGCGMLMVENIEIPFIRLGWYGLYFVMGVYFDDEKTIESN